MSTIRPYTRYINVGILIVKKFNQKGFGAVAIILAVLLTLVIAAAGYMVIKNQFNKSEDETSLYQNYQQNLAHNSSDATTDTSYIEIPEWGVKLGVGPHSDMVTVTEPNNYENDKSEIQINVKPEYELFEDCTTDISIMRLKDISGFDETPKNKVGEYYYYNSGISECGGSKETGNANTLSQSELILQFNKLGVKSL